MSAPRSFSGAMVRYRAYSTKGLSAAEVALLVGICSLTFGLGVFLLGGIVLVVEPALLRRLGRFLPTSHPPGNGTRHRDHLSGRSLPPMSPGSVLQLKPLGVGGFRDRISTPRHCLAPVPRRVDGAHRRGWNHLFRPAGTGNPGYIVILGNFSGVVFGGPGLERAGGAWRLRAFVPQGAAGFAPGQGPDGFAGLPAILSFDPARLCDRGRHLLRTPQIGRGAAPHGTAEPKLIARGNAGKSIAPENAGL